MPTKPTVNSLTDMPERYTCWGLFKMWCGAPPSEGESKVSSAGVLRYTQQATLAKALLHC